MKDLNCRSNKFGRSDLHTLSARARGTGELSTDREYLYGEFTSKFPGEGYGFGLAVAQGDVYADTGECNR